MVTRLVDSKSCRAKSSRVAAVAKPLVAVISSASVHMTVLFRSDLSGIVGGIRLKPSVNLIEIQGSRLPLNTGGSTRSGSRFAGPSVTDANRSIESKGLKIKAYLEMS